MPISSYVIALGSNRRGRHGSPRAQVRAALALLGRVQAVSRLRETAPLGPSRRRFANAVALIRSEEAPDALLRRLKAIEREFGRRRGQRWGARVIDLDIVLWSGGCWRTPALTVPHLSYRERRFVLAPLAEIAPDWRDPVSGRKTHALLHAVDRPRPRA
ncbi:2-amino-4-hydroxy-6-hydroxymethyldihydropteridine diphosphokinase [Sphingomonas sp. HT-1]|uniref:2-amino-4-hydroxy-6- hydroxymethyldihydropteridine diphosphokinase n=1 Tax=unclassified Sphingomonas TaxID=196159 RepID=UPI00037C118A|nr:MULTISPECIES: 2-amino-4-hydroxy-6-hydroxymethyldihydropteridine diphosphokinase [unclassified Sphingomonas]KTF70576.1 7,8-dihydro-6-hydroxymethylpterin-pyrophosphokinase [Sphingomonas sp. WG]